MIGDYRLLILVLWPFVGACIGYLIGRKDSTYRDYFADFVVIAEFIYVLWLFPALREGGREDFLLEGFCGLNLHLRLDGFREIYGSVAAYIWMMTTLVSREYFAHYENRNRYYLFVLPTLGATMGLFLSADLFTVYLFCQIISFTSFVGIAHDERDYAVKAASTYLAAEIIGGALIFSGLNRLYLMFGTLEIDVLRDAVLALEDRSAVYAAGAFLFFGFGAKAGMFPLHFWMNRAHAGSPAPISTLLSAIITKTGVFGVILVCANIFFGDQAWGIFLLILGTFTMLLGAVRAVFGAENYTVNADLSGAEGRLTQDDLAIAFDDGTGLVRHARYDGGNAWKISLAAGTYTYHVYAFGGFALKSGSMTAEEGGTFELPLTAADLDIAIPDQETNGTEQILGGLGTIDTFVYSGYMGLEGSEIEDISRFAAETRFRFANGGTMELQFVRWDNTYEIKFMINEQNNGVSYMLTSERAPSVFERVLADDGVWFTVSVQDGVASVWAKNADDEWEPLKTWENSLTWDGVVTDLAISQVEFRMRYDGTEGDTAVLRDTVFRIGASAPEM